MAGNGHDTTTEAAFVIRIAGQAGPRAIEVTFGCPMNMGVNDLNAYVDKVCMVIDRQTHVGELNRAKLDLEAAEKAVVTHQEHRADFEAAAIKDWERRGRQGPPKFTDSQAAQVANFDKTIKELRDVRIPAFRAKIAELENLLAVRV